MKLACYIDGHQKTTFGELTAHHTIATSITIKKEHQAAWREMLEHILVVEWEFPKDRSKPVPVVFSECEILDICDDNQDEPHVAPYWDDIQYMCGGCEASMGHIYLMGKSA